MQRHTVFLVTAGECGWAAVRLALKTLPDVSIVETPSINATLVAMRDCFPDLILMSPDLPRALLAGQCNGFVPQSGRRYRLTVIRSSPDITELPYHPAFEVVGHLLWRDLTAANLPSILATLLMAHVLLTSPEVAARFLVALRPTLGVPPLTDRERQIVHLLAEGLTDEEIAAREPVSERTVERLVARLTIAWGAPTRLALGVEIARRGLLDQPGA